VTFDFADIARTICRDDLFGEEVVYGQADGTSRTIRAAVKRGVVQPVDDTEGVRPYVEITVEDDAITGISLDELETSTDTLALARRPGGSRETMAVARILRSANGILVLEVR